MKESPDPPPKLPLELEVMPPEPEQAKGKRSGKVPFHAWSATLLLVVDNLWAMPDFAVITLMVTVPACFLMVFLGVFLIQRRSGGDSVGIALAKALLLAAVAAVPTQIMGTPVGLALLAWAGIRHPWK